MPPSKERQRQIARAKLERQMARRAAAARRRRRVQAGIGAFLGLLAVIAGTVFLVVKFGGGDDKASTAAGPKCSYKPAPATPQNKTVKDVGVPSTKDVPTTGTRTVSLKTSVGLIEIAMDQAAAPCTANSFAFLASKKYFDGSFCHRMVIGKATDKSLKVLQCGDPFGKGTGGPAYRYGAENLPTNTVTSAQGAKAATYTRGMVAMANGGPDTNGSQFFIVYGDSILPPDYNIVGEVTAGLELVDKVAKAGVVPRDPKDPTDGTPKLKVTLQTVTVDPDDNG